VLSSTEARLSRISGYFFLMSKTGKSVLAITRNSDNVATVATVATVWTASIDIFFVSKTHDTVATVASNYLNSYLVYKHTVCNRTL
jgi:hypothetical protein